MGKNIKSLFEHINKMSSLFVAPYHREYSWQESDCAEFLNNAIFKNDSLMDFGVITYQKCDELGNFILIDGYQRLMTILLFVQALIKTNKIKLAQKNQPANFLVKTNDDGEDVFKLKINNNDKNDIEKILKNNFENAIFHNKKFLENFKFFVNRIEQENISVLTILNNIAKIQIINLVIDNEISDEEQVYFSVNKNFSQVDLIRNYIYDTLKESKQGHIFNTYWLSLEKNLPNLKHEFLKDYMTIQNNGEIPKDTELFENFKAFFKKMVQLKQKDDIIKQMTRYSSYYSKIIKSDVKDIVLNEKLSLINAHEAKDTYPYLMEVFEDYDFAHINKHMLVDILDTVIMFVNQREAAPEGSTIIDFASLSKDINRMLILKDLSPQIKTIEDSSTSIETHSVTINNLINKTAL